MAGFIAFVGILVMILVILLFLEFTPVSFSFKKQKTLVGVMDEMDQTDADTVVTGLRKTLFPLEKPVQKYAGPKLLKKMKYSLYWGQMGGKYIGWTPVQLVTMRVFFAIIAGLLGAFVFRNMMYVVVSAFLGWTYPMLSLNGTARRTARTFQAQLPEYLQLVNGKMAAGISFDEAIRRTSKAESLPALWMRNNIKMAQGRSLLDQIMQEAVESQSTELISTASQLDNLKHGAKQQELLDRLATQISNAFTASADMRAEKIGAELVIPMVLFYFLPFLVSLLIVIAFPVVQGGMF